MLGDLTRICSHSLLSITHSKRGVRLNCFTGVLFFFIKCHKIGFDPHQLPPKWMVLDSGHNTLYETLCHVHQSSCVYVSIFFLPVKIALFLCVQIGVLPPQWPKKLADFDIHNLGDGFSGCDQAFGCDRYMQFCFKRYFICIITNISLFITMDLNLYISESIICWFVYEDCVVRTGEQLACRIFYLCIYTANKGTCSCFCKFEV